MITRHSLPFECFLRHLHQDKWWCNWTSSQANQAGSIRACNRGGCSQFDEAATWMWKGNGGGLEFGNFAPYDVFTSLLWGSYCFHPIGIKSTLTSHCLNGKPINFSTSPCTHSVFENIPFSGTPFRSTIVLNLSVLKMDALPTWYPGERINFSSTANCFLLALRKCDLAGLDNSHGYLVLIFRIHKDWYSWMFFQDHNETLHATPIHPCPTLLTFSLSHCLSQV